MSTDPVVSHCLLLLRSYQRVTGRELIAVPALIEELPLLLDAADFALVSHGTEEDPVFNYGNRTALNLFAMSREEFTKLPSRYSAEQPNREERARLLEAVTRNGFIDNYSGVRIAKDGRRFRISRATVWNVTDEQGVYRGQAAVFALPEE